MQAARVIIATVLVALTPLAAAEQIGRQAVEFGYVSNTCSGLSNGAGRNPGDVFSMFGLEHDCHAAQGVAMNAAAVATSSHVNPTERASGQAQGTATWGQLKLRSAYSGPNTARVPMAAASGGWVDELQIDAVNPSIQGTAGILNVQVQVQGFLQVTGPRSGASVSLASYANDVPFSQGRFSSGISTDINPSFVELAINQLVTLKVPFVFGTRFEWSLFADAVAGTVVRSSRTDVNTGLSDFGHTLTWQGFGDITRNGVAVDYRVDALSGIDWTQTFAPPVPEPATWALLVGGLLLGAVRQRQLLRA